MVAGAPLARALQASRSHHKNSSSPRGWQGQILLDQTKKFVIISNIQIFRWRWIVTRVILKERGQITIPAKLRKDLMLEVGDLMEIEVRGTYIVLKPLHVTERGVSVSEGSPEGLGP